MLHQRLGDAKQSNRHPDDFQYHRWQIEIHRQRNGQQCRAKEVCDVEPQCVHLRREIAIRKRRNDEEAPSKPNEVSGERR